MTKRNNSPEAVAKRIKLATALKTNLAKRKALAKQQAKRAQTDQNIAAIEKIDAATD